MEIAVFLTLELAWTATDASYDSAKYTVQTYNIKIENNLSYVIITSLLNRCQQSNVKNIQVTCI